MPPVQVSVEKKCPANQWGFGLCGVGNSLLMGRLKSKGSGLTAFKLKISTGIADPRLTFKFYSNRDEKWFDL